MFGRDGWSRAILYERLLWDVTTSLTNQEPPAMPSINSSLAGL